MGEIFESPLEALEEGQRRRLEPLGPVNVVLSRVLAGLNQWAMRLAFRLAVSGLEHLESTRPLVFTPNHSSSLDALVMAAAIPQRHLWCTYWAGRDDAIRRGVVRRYVSRLGRAVPVGHGPSALAMAAAVLQRGDNLVWFPEGHRTTTGKLQPLQPGIGVLLEATRVPALPVWIHGAYDCMPPPAQLPRRFKQVHVCFDRPLAAEGSADDIVGAIERRLLELQRRFADAE